MKKIGIFLSIFFLFTDQLLKFYELKVERSFTLIPRVFYLHSPLYNQGIAFGIMSKNSFLASFFSILALFFILIALIRFPRYRIPLLILISGATSNILDRIFRGGVIDYFSLKGFPWSFNLADMMIIWGTVHYLIITFWKNASNSN